MIKVYVYEVGSNLYKYSDSGLPSDVTIDIPDNHDFTLTPPPNRTQTWRWIDTEWVELLPINNPNIPYDDVSVWDSELNQWVADDDLLTAKKASNQALAWERIKAKRLQSIASGVYVESIDKWFHTDEVSATTYSTIAGMIALDNYEPVQWKTMDNTWLLLTEQLLKELQTAMSAKTNSNYAVAEQHKAAMIEATNPLEYDYSEGWV